MKAHSDSVPYQDTGFFSKLIIDYLEKDNGLFPFYTHMPDMEGLKASIASRKQFNQDRELLFTALEQQYEGLDISPAIATNLAAIRQATTFTITTAHQPNILTGPLYFIYKILHAIRLANELKKTLPQYDFVPVYYVGSEDADLDELGHIFLNGEKLEWQTGQTGAVGRMNTKGIEKLIARLEGEFGDKPFGKKMAELCRKAYLQNNTVQQATLWLVNELFKAYGLLVVIPDNALLKKAFNEVVKKELTTQFSYPLVQETIDRFSPNYKVQAAGRSINLFYLNDDGSRERIELKQPGEYLIVNKDISFSRDAILAELDQHPERFSTNVILRGVFQETILPNIAFIGGGGEIAYWLELKKVFEAADVPYPVLLLRNSFLLVLPKQQQSQQKLGLSTKELFFKEPDLVNELVKRNTHNKLDTKSEQDTVYKLYKQLQERGSAIDPTLKAHIAALHIRTLQGLAGLEKKMLRAEKRKHADVTAQVKQLHAALFPNGNLQERVDNFMPLYATYGDALVHVLLEHSQPLTESFTVLYIDQD